MRESLLEDDRTEQGGKTYWKAQWRAFIHEWQTFFQLLIGKEESVHLLVKVQDRKCEVLATGCTCGRVFWIKHKHWKSDVPTLQG